MEEVFLTPEQAAEMLNLSTYTVRCYARQGIIPAYKIGRAWRFSRDGLLEWLREKQQPSYRQDNQRFIIKDGLSGVTLDRPLTAFDPEENLLDSDDTRREAIETLLAIRARARKCSVAALLRESRRELLRKGSGGAELE